MPAVVSPTAGTRVEPIDGYVFVRGTTVKFKTILLSDGRPTTVDVGESPTAQILQPQHLDKSGSPVPVSVANLVGSLVSGQDFEYEFEWDMPSNMVPGDQWVISYSGKLGGSTLNFGDEFFTIIGTAGQVGIRSPSYATVDDVRMSKFNIDDYMPQAVRDDLTERNNIIEFHLRKGTTKLREELNLFKARGNSENYKLFTANYAIWSILLAARGEDGSSVSEQNINHWRREWEDILAQEKRESSMQSVGLGRG